MNSPNQGTLKRNMAPVVILGEAPDAPPATVLLLGWLGASNRCPSMLPRTWLAVDTASSMDTRSSALRKLTNTSDCGARNRYLTKYAEVYKKKTSGVIIACTAPPFDVMLVSFPERGAVGSCLPHWRERAASIRTRAKRLPS